MVYKFMKKCSMTLAIRKMQIRTTVRHHLTLVRMAIFKKTKISASMNVQKRELLYIVVRDVN
jgi:hypothetical protein